MRLSRREFAWGLAGISAAAGAIIETGVLEQRVYSPGSVLPTVEILQRSGMRSVSVQSTGNGTEYLIAFESLEARAKAWDQFNGDSGWRKLREFGSVHIREIRLWPQPGGKILAMSL
jgi:hypothetical protein